MGLSGWHLLILALVALLVFGGSGRISSIMGEDERPEARASDPRIIDQRPVKSPERDTTKTS